MHNWLFPVLTVINEIQSFKCNGNLVFKGHQIDTTVKDQLFKNQQDAKENTSSVKYKQASFSLNTFNDHSILNQ